MINKLIKYKNTLNDFISYLKDQTDINTFFKLDFKYQFGFYVEFLSLKNITIMYDCYNFIVYYEGIEATKHYRNTKSIIISESNTTNITNILSPIENFKLGLIESFKHLENPF
jgi:hypothetical protein